MSPSQIIIFRTFYFCLVQQVLYLKMRENYLHFITLMQLKGFSSSLIFFFSEWKTKQPNKKPPLFQEKHRKAKCDAKGSCSQLAKARPAHGLVTLQPQHTFPWSHHRGRMLATRHSQGQRLLFALHPQSVCPLAGRRGCVVHKCHWRYFCPCEEL